jgi:peptidoglycan hydrolase-like protein with peptidoglycan-binding domain
MALKQLGYYRGCLDGDMGPGTTLAYIRWQQAQDNGAADGIVTPVMGHSLGFNMIRSQSVLAR